MHAESMIDGAALSSRQLALFAACVMIGCVATAMAIAAGLVFPIPFVSITFSMAMVTILLGSFRAVVGGRVFREITGRRDQLLRFTKFASVQMSMTMIYPAYQLLFQAANNTRWELPVLLLLPVLKLLLKNLFVRSFSSKEDMNPEGVIFTVDFFSALYLATCIQTVKSISTIVVIMTVDLVETIIELHDLHRRTHTILSRLRSAAGTSTSLLDAVRTLCHRLEELRTQLQGSIRTRSCISHRVSREGELLLQQLDSRSQISNSLRLTSDMSFIAISARTPRKRWCSCGDQGKSAVLASNAVLPVTANSRAKSRHSVDGKFSALPEALEALFTSECLVLTEYLETIIPFLYGNFILVMVHLPSAQYHDEMAGVTSGNAVNTVRSVFVYGMLEFVSFLVLAVVMRRNCGIQALYHLAFVLETQASSVQSKLILWTIMTLTYRIAHFGADFSFQFAWIGV